MDTYQRMSPTLTAPPKRCRITVEHDCAGYLVGNREIVAAFHQAHAIKSEATRAGVLYILKCALINANDTLHDGYDKWAQQDYGTPGAFWRGMFYATAQSHSCERETLPAVYKWLARRGLGG